MPTEPRLFFKVTVLLLKSNSYAPLGAFHSINTMKNTLYFYSVPAFYEDQLALGRKPMLKIGQTTQETAEVRIKQQDGTACAQSLVKHASFEVPFTDKDFHRYLLDRNYKKTRDDADREWFHITVEEATLLVKKFSEFKGSKAVAQKRKLQLTEWQKRALRFLGESIISGKEVTVLELAARFGKTLAMLAAFKFSGHRVMVIANYVKTVNTSFRKEAALYFADEIATVDASEEDFQEKVTAYLAEGLKVLITFSIFKSSRLVKNVEFVRSLNGRLIVVDEADYGAHTPAQREKIEVMRQGAHLVLMTGTNSDRAAKDYSVDAYFSVTYPDMLLIRDGSL
jgi:hypothetical protein